MQVMVFLLGNDNGYFDKTCCDTTVGVAVGTAHCALEVVLAVAMLTICDADVVDANYTTMPLYIVYTVRRLLFT